MASFHYFILIFILHFLLDPSVDFTVIVTVFPFPAFWAITVPLELTVAYFELELVHLSFLFACFPDVITLVFKGTVTIHSRFADTINRAEL